MCFKLGILPTQSCTDVPLTAPFIIAAQISPRRHFNYLLQADIIFFLTKLAYDFIYLQITIQAGKYVSNFHYQPKKNYQQSLDSKLNQLRKDSNCFLCPQRNEPHSAKILNKRVGYNLFHGVLVNNSRVLFLFLGGCVGLFTLILEK